MRRDVLQVLQASPELRQYVRQHPVWYRRLARDPGQLQAMEKEANYFYGRTLPQRVEKMQNQLGLAMMMIEMLRMGQATVAQAQAGQ
ncbi:YlbE-like family protein [Alkalihalobacillus oceani]|uniref:YlbE-like family protein n=1 Tax=Halalkalibacter oceani TaxID=1653776 RepID=UPI00204260B0|nr:YlbE-like family protein [Halalkalibacter oceani]